MTDSPATQPSLLIRLRNPADTSAWRQFVELYGPVIFDYYRKQRIQDADVSDLTQEVLRNLFDAVPKWVYDSSKGTFRGWLFTIVRNQLRSHWKQSVNLPAAEGGSAALEQLHSIEDEARSQADWDATIQRQTFHYAAELIRGDFSEATWQAFWRTAVEGLSAGQVSQELGLTPAAVYLARSRVMARLKQQVQRLVTEST